MAYYRRRRLWPLLILAGALGAGVLVVLVIGRYYERLHTIAPPCLLYHTTGLYCAGCGITRALHALAHGQVGRAIGYNPLVVLGLPALLLWLADTLLRMYLGLHARRVPTAVVWALVVALALYTVLRNLPWFPFTVLAP